MEPFCLFYKHIIVLHDLKEFVAPDFDVLILQLILDFQIHFPAAVPWQFLAYRIDQTDDHLGLFLADFLCSEPLVEGLL